MPSIASKVKIESDGTQRLEHTIANVSFEYVRYPNGKEILGISERDTDQVVELHGREIGTLLSIVDAMN